MVFEATVVCIDNSEWSRNGDYLPTRLMSQLDAANVILMAKSQQHPENCVGIVTMAGDRVEVRVAPTINIGKILSSFDKLKSIGKSNIIRGIQTAQFALKLRQNKTQKQRIVCFVCSPIENDIKELELLGKSLRKNNVAIDIVSFGPVEENAEKLNKLHSVTNSHNNSHYIEFPSGDISLADSLITTAVVQEEGAEAPVHVPVSGGFAAGGDVDMFGVDPNTDPELYLAIRLSLEEAERQRRADEEAAAAAAPATEAPAEEAAVPAAPETADVEMKDESAKKDETEEKK